MAKNTRIDVDLYSDTVTRPTADMRRFMCEAEVGDEQKLEDPTVNLLCEMVAELLGKEAAVFLPSGTMCNEIALRVHARPGEEVIAHATAHPIHFETGGPGALAGVNMRSIDRPRGQVDAVGAAMAGSRAFIDEAWRCKQQMGGAMRQAGIIAAGGVYALRHHVKRLADDHANARRLAEGLARLPGVTLDPASVETNIVFFETTANAAEAVEHMLAHGVRMGALGPHTIRAVTHLDVDAAGIERALAVAREVFTGLPG